MCVFQVFGGDKCSGSRDSGHSKSPWGHFTETVREKFETVRNRRYSKEQSDRETRYKDQSDRDTRADKVECGHYSDTNRLFVNHDNIHQVILKIVYGSC